jgi:hypothetical protein
MIDRTSRNHGSLLASCVLAIGFLLAFAATAPDADARRKDKGPPCAKADERLAARGVGDTDQDGLSNCREKKITRTSPRDDDTDGDGIEDGEEVANGTNPLAPDSDGDTLSDGVEDELGTDPLDEDSDDDGERDCDEKDPAGELDSKIESGLQAIVCPTDVADGSLTVLGIEIVLTADTEFEDATCEELAEILVMGGAHVEVKVEEVGANLVAHEVEVEDRDHDGRPDDDHGDDHDDDDEDDDLDDDSDEDEDD